jgi:hypothetical protein
MGEEQMGSVGRITRRTVLTRGAVATGAFWAVPVVDSFLSPAAAASPVPVETSLSIFALEITCGATVYSVKVNKTADNKFPGALEWGITSPNVPQCGANIFQPTTTSPLTGFQVSMDPTTQEVSVVVPSSCSITDSRQKCGPGCATAVVKPGFPETINSGTQKRYTFVACPSGGG